MTLLQAIRAIEGVASRQPSVNMIVENDIFRLNAIQDARYGVFGWTQGQHSGNVDSAFFSYRFTFFYVDRLTNDRSNQIEIQSVGIETLDNVIRQINDLGLVVDTDYTMQTFNQRFVDECAGVFCSLLVSVPVGSSCPESFADFSADFSSDFYVL